MIPLIKKLVNIKVAITEIYPQIPWELVVDLLGTLEPLVQINRKRVGWNGPLELEHCLISSVPYICMVISCKPSYGLQY
jgi:hypothetical protein